MRAKLIICPICEETHSSSYLEITAIGHQEKDQQYDEHDYVVIYCNHSDESRRYVY